MLALLDIYCIYGNVKDMGYTKLFSSLVASTIWREDNPTRIVWITMLALRNERNEVEASIPGLADLARVSLDECQKALKKLGEPDKWSRNKENEGRRIEACRGGWKILNGDYYRRLLSDEEKREYQRLYHREYRLKKGKPLGGEKTHEKLVNAGLVEL